MKWLKATSSSPCLASRHRNFLTSSVQKTWRSRVESKQVPMYNISSPLHTMLKRDKFWPVMSTLIVCRHEQFTSNIFSFSFVETKTRIPRVNFYQNTFTFSIVEIPGRQGQDFFILISTCILKISSKTNGPIFLINMPKWSLDCYIPKCFIVFLLQHF